MRRSHWVGWLALVCAGGCGAPGQSVDEPTASVEMAVFTVPTGIQCIQMAVSVDGQAQTVAPLTVTAGAQTASLSVGQLPAGTGVFSGSAYNVACTDIATATPTYIADPATAELRPGVLTRVEIIFRKNNGVTVSANFLDNIKDIAVGAASSYALLASTTGTVLQWGLGPSSTFLRTPQTVSSLTNVAQVAGGGNSAVPFACARKNDGNVFCWGNNLGGVLGPNTGLNTTVTTPIQVPLPGGALDISAGSGHVCAVVAEPSLASPTAMTVRCWGSNTNGQLGNGTTTSSATPVLATVNNAARVFAGDRHTCALLSDSRLSCWGSNSWGQLGDGTTTEHSSPTPVPNLSAIVDVAAGLKHTCALRADGLVRCWGNNNQGQLGDGSFTQRLTPVEASGVTDATQLAAGYLYTCALRPNGIWCWGDGVLGELGDGTGTNHETPTLVPGLENPVSVRAHNGSHTCAQLDDLSVWCWGYNGAGQIGDGTVINAPEPTQVHLQ